MSLDARSSPLDDTAGASPRGEIAASNRPDGHALGPLLLSVRIESGVSGRLYAAGLSLAAMAVLAVAAMLTPATGGMGTHRQLGLPPCGFVAMSGLPCPTCGMTTAFALAVRGRLGESVRAQAAGFGLAVMTAMVAVIALVAAITGRRATVNWYRVEPTRLIWLGALVFVLAWGLKIAIGLMDKTLPVR